MNTLENYFQPATGTSSEWSEALTRVEDYLRAHRLGNRIRLSEIAMSIVREAAALHAADPSQNPVALSTKVAQDRLDQWFASKTGALDMPGERQSALGRMAFLACDGPARYQDLFLDESQLPEELRNRLRNWTVRAGPNLEVSRMAPREIDLGLIPEVAEDAWEGLERWPYVRMALLWVLFGLTMAAVFLLTHTGNPFAQ